MSLARTRLPELVTFVLTVAIVCPSFGQSDSQGRLMRYVAQAKSEGKHTVFLSSPIGVFGEASTLPEALSVYSVFIATPISRKITSVEGYEICTWYKLHVDERISVHPNPEEAATQIPDELSPVKRDELVIVLHGGALLLDGVQVMQEYSPIPALAMGKQYLLFTRQDKTGQYALLQAGANSVFRLTSDDTVEPLSPKSTLFQKDIKERTANRLSFIKSEALQGYTSGSSQ